MPCVFDNISKENQNPYNKDKASKGRGEETRTVTTVSDSAPTNPLTPKYEDVGVSKTQIVQLTHLAGVLCFTSQYRTNAWLLLINMIYAARVAGAT